MNPQLKLGLYILTALGTLVFGLLFLSAWRKADGRPASNAPTTVSAGVSLTETNQAGGTNGVIAEVNAGVAAEPTPEREPVELRPAIAARGFGRILLWGLLALFSLVGLGALAAYDVAQYAGRQATDALFDDQGEDVRPTAYEQVEKAYGEGEFLEAIRLLRDFLKDNPKAVHAQIRIAEIYEKDLNNPLAAALEYEEVLQHRFAPDRKGWTAIHLVNLYNRLDKPNEAVALLQRVVGEFPGTPAAAKARERLESAGIEIPEPPTANPDGGGGEEPPSPGNLPRGFRPKGR